LSFFLVGGSIRLSLPRRSPCSLDAEEDRSWIDCAGSRHTPHHRVIALDPETGAERWAYDLKVDRARRAWE